MLHQPFLDFRRVLLKLWTHFRVQDLCTICFEGRIISQLTQWAFFTGWVREFSLLAAQGFFFFLLLGNRIIFWHSRELSLFQVPQIQILLLYLGYGKPWRCRHDTLLDRQVQIYLRDRRLCFHSEVSFNLRTNSSIESHFTFRARYYSLVMVKYGIWRWRLSVVYSHRIIVSQRWMLVASIILRRICRRLDEMIEHTWLNLEVRFSRRRLRLDIEI